jgi:transposase
MDWLIKGKNKEKIENEIAVWVKTLFPVEVVFYDITNIQFEGWEELKQARHGYVRLGRKNHKQILLGVVMIEGLPVVSHIFRGNRAEKTTLLWIKDKVKKQFNVSRVVTVCDRGMITDDSLLEIESKGDGYITALKRRRCQEIQPLLEKDLSLFSAIKTDKEGNVLLKAQEAEKEDGKRRIIVYNPIKAEEEKKKREDIIKELEKELIELSDAVKKGEKKSVKNIITSAEKILNRKNGKRYFSYTCKKDGEFQYSANEKGLELEEKLDGKFVIKTTEQNLSLEQVVFRYKDLMDIEDGFRNLKDFIKVAPVFHWRYRRVKAHVFICVLALLLEKYLEQKLSKAKIKLSARKALDKLKNIKIVENKVGHLNLKYITPPNRETEKILEACGIFNLPKILSEPFAKTAEILEK